MGPRLTGRPPPFFTFELRFPAREDAACKRDHLVGTRHGEQ